MPDLKNSWIFPVVQSLHLVGLALLVGTIIIADLRALGMMNRGPASDLRRWTWAGAIIMLTTGPVMFLGDIARYSINPAFLLKLPLVAAALFFQFVIQRKAVLSRGAAVISVALWTCVVLVARAIADFDVY